ncbi:MAG: transcription-repair coupling factor [Candidatus Coatesbacteria bacterium]
MGVVRFRHPDILQRLRGFQPWEAVVRAARDEEGRIRAEGVSGAARGLVAAGLAAETGRPVVAILPDLESARDFHDEVASFLPHDAVFLLPDRDLAPYEPGPVSPQLASLRLGALPRLPDLEAGVVVTTATAFQEALPAPNRLRAVEIDLRAGVELDREAFLHRLVAAGYRRVDLVELAGDFAARGAIVDVHAPGLGRPLRIELEGNTIASLRSFDAASQRSLETIECARLGAAAEALLTPEERLALLERLPDPLSTRGAQRVARLRERLEAGSSLEGEERYLPWLLGTCVRLDAYLPPRSIRLVVEPSSVREALDHRVTRCAALYEELLHAREPLPSPAETCATLGEAWGSIEAAPRVLVSQFGGAVGGETVSFGVKPRRYGLREFEAFLAHIRGWGEAKVSVVIAVESTEEREALEKRLKEAEAVKKFAPPAWVEGRWTGGADLIAAGLVLLPAREVLGGTVRRAASKRLPKVMRDVFSDLVLGDPVVHEEYGIGLYRGVVPLVIEGARQDFFMIEYAGNEKLYLPADQVHRLQKYLGTGKVVSLSHLGTEAWERTKARVAASLRLFAEKLLKLYAERLVAKATPYPAQPQVEAEFAATFPYEETPDQERAITEVGKDLAESKPVDRLVCGDVGYGKTEVILRAAFRVAIQGGQVAVLVPTTILAQQHWQNFRTRMAGTPVTVDVLSRFRDPKARRATLKLLESGGLDIVVGTHHLLSQSVKFKRLGLLVIDEEHRFGVKQKERLKEFKKNVHVLTLSATPIPRTLNMGLAGLRDLTVIETPPPGRLAVLTHVHEENPPVVREAILRELGRGGQVFYLHNRVQSIAVCAEKLKELVPEARLAVAHGQMQRGPLEKAMTTFAAGKADVLVCTSIIGAGLDLPNANTLIIERAEMFGLADLYQLRGRVGRSRRQAYAYFFFSPRGAPTLDARRRLAAMLEFGELGSGFRLALRDLEIRGAGNLLGAQQHGALYAVGFDLYTRLLNSAVQELKGEVTVEEVPPKLTLGLEAYLPDQWVPDSRSKLEVYKRLSACAGLDDLAVLLEELRDRYGTPPPPVRLLAGQAQVRILGIAGGLESVIRRGPTLALTFRSRDALVRAMPPVQRRGWEARDRVLSVPAPRDPEELLELLRGLLGGSGVPVAGVAGRGR